MCGVKQQIYMLQMMRIVLNVSTSLCVTYLTQEILIVASLPSYPANPASLAWR